MCECGNTRLLGERRAAAQKHDAGRVKGGRVAGWKGGREMDGYIEDTLDKQVGVGGSAVRGDSLSFICRGLALCVRDHPGES